MKPIPIAAAAAALSDLLIFVPFSWGRVSMLPAVLSARVFPERWMVAKRGFAVLMAVMSAQLETLLRLKTAQALKVKRGRPRWLECMHIESERPGILTNVPVIEFAQMN